MLLEAIALKVKKEDMDAQEKATQEAERRSFKSDFSKLDRHR